MKIGLYTKVVNTPRQVKLMDDIIGFLLSEQVDLYLHSYLASCLENKYGLPEFDYLCKKNAELDYLCLN
jgi:hypothetical protein